MLVLTRNEGEEVYLTVDNGPTARLKVRAIYRNKTADLMVFEGRFPVGDHHHVRLDDRIQLPGNCEMIVARVGRSKLRLAFKAPRSTIITRHPVNPDRHGLAGKAAQHG